MPKYASPDNRGVAQRDPRHTRGRGAHVTSIAQLLTASPALRQRAKEAFEKQTVIAWLQSQLAADFRPHVSAAELRGGVLVVTADSAAWSARLRYVLLPMLPVIEKRWPEISACQVRVRPARAARPA